MIKNIVRYNNVKHFISIKKGDVLAINFVDNHGFICDTWLAFKNYFK